MKLSRENERALFSSSMEMEAICQPLFQNTPIDYFDYERYYCNGEGLLLTNNPDVLSSVVSKGTYPDLNELNQLLAEKSSVVFLSERFPISRHMPKEMVSQYADKIKTSSHAGVYNRIYLVSKHDDYFRVCGFGAKKDSPELFEFFINSIPLLEQFIDYFECEGHDLIQQEGRRKNIFPDNDHILTLDDEEDGLAKKTGLNLRINNKTIYLTSREKECLALYLQGYTAKEIADVLKISHRTIERHIYSAKKAIGPVSRDYLRKVFVFQNNLQESAGLLETI